MGGSGTGGRGSFRLRMDLGESAASEPRPDLGKELTSSLSDLKIALPINKSNLTYYNG